MKRPGQQFKHEGRTWQIESVRHTGISFVAVSIDGGRFERRTFTPQEVS